MSGAVRIILLCRKATSVFSIFPVPDISARDKTIAQFTSFLSSNEARYSQSAWLALLKLSSNQVRFNYIYPLKFLLQQVDRFQKAFCINHNDVFFIWK